MEKGEDCILLDNTDSQRWRVRNSRAAAGVVPSICLTFPPPDTETKRKVTDLNDQFQAFIKLWKEKQSKLKLDMVFATMSVIKQWDSAKVWTKVSTGAWGYWGIIPLYVNTNEVSLHYTHVW